MIPLFASLLACTAAPDKDDTLDSGTDGGVDSATEGDTDTDSDGDTDSDTDADSDTDTDTGTVPVDLDADGYTTATDCDDDDPDIHPGANDLCYDGVDRDCDGVARGCPFAGEVDVDGAGAKIVGDGGYLDEFGTSLAVADVDVDGYADVLVWSRGTLDGSQPRGRLSLFPGPVHGDLAASDAAATIDGLDDYRGISGSTLLVGDYYETGTLQTLVKVQVGVLQDSVRVVPIPGSGATDVGSATLTIEGDSDGDSFGSAVWAGDADSDGVPDLAIGATGVDGGGAAYVWSGFPTGSVAPGDADGTLSGSGTQELGDGLWLGDLDGDGMTDLLVADGGSATSPGALYYESAYAPGDLDLADASGRLDGDVADEHLGAALCVADLDHDGIGDILASAPYNSETDTYAGAVYFWTGVPSGTAPLADGAILRGDAWYGFAGDRTWCGDLDGDGDDEATVSTFDNASIVYLLVDAPAGDALLSSVPDRFVGDDDRLSTMAVGDVDGDGVNDVALGAPTDDTVDTAAGAVFLLYGPEP